MMPTLQERIENDFSYHRPPVDAQAPLQAIRDKAKEFAHFIVNTVPAGREQSSALTRLEEAMFHACAGIARQHPITA
jgi:hypothetical protein